MRPVPDPKPNSKRKKKIIYCTVDRKIWQNQMIRKQTQLESVDFSVYYIKIFNFTIFANIVLNCIKQHDIKRNVRA